MVMRFSDMIEEYVNHESEAIAFRIGHIMREILEDFGRFMTEEKGPGWQLSEVTNVEVMQYYITYAARQDWHAERNATEVHAFMTFARKREWIEKDYRDEEDHDEG